MIDYRTALRMMRTALHTAAASATDAVHAHQSSTGEHGRMLARVARIEAAASYVDDAYRLNPFMPITGAVYLQVGEEIARLLD